MPRPNIEDLRELFGLREAIECYAVQEAVARATPARVAVLEACCRRQLAGIRRFTASGRTDLDEQTELQIGEADMAFHRTLFEACANKWVQKTVSDLRLMSRVLARRVDASRENLLSVLVFVYRCHRRILSAVRRGDAEAASHWTCTHIREGRDRFTRQLQNAQSPDEPWPPSLRQAISRLEHFDSSESTNRPQTFASSSPNS